MSTAQIQKPVLEVSQRPMEPAVLSDLREPSGAAMGNSSAQSAIDKYEAYLRMQKNKQDFQHPKPDFNGSSGHVIARLNSTEKPPRRQRGRVRRSTARSFRRPRTYASPRGDLEYEYIRFKKSRLRDGHVQLYTMWAPTWLDLGCLRGDRAMDEARAMVIQNYGEDQWQKEAQSLELDEDDDTECTLESLESEDSGGSE